MTVVSSAALKLYDQPGIGVPDRIRRKVAQCSGQIVGRLVYERLIARPDRLYGGAIGSSYQRQGLALSKHFKRLSP